jgi:hypothetical protein
MSPREY